MHLKHNRSSTPLKTKIGNNKIIRIPGKCSVDPSMTNLLAQKLVITLVYLKTISISKCTKIIKKFPIPGLKLKIVQRKSIFNSLKKVIKKCSYFNKVTFRSNLGFLAKKAIQLKIKDVPLSMKKHKPMWNSREFRSTYQLRKTLHYTRHFLHLSSSKLWLQTNSVIIMDLWVDSDVGRLEWRLLLNQQVWFRIILEIKDKKISNKALRKKLKKILCGCKMAILQESPIFLCFKERKIRFSQSNLNKLK